MSEPLEFEVRPIEGISVAVGEEVTFREEDGKLLALNEDGEAFGTVPRSFAARLEGAGIDSFAAKVASRTGDIPVVSVPGLESENHLSQEIGDSDPSTCTPVEEEEAGAGQSSSRKSASEKKGRGKQPKKHGHRAIIVAVVAVAVVLLLAVYVFLIPHKAADVSEGMYDVGLEVVEVVNNYLDGYLSSEAASEELDDLASRAEEINARSEKAGDSSVYDRIETIQIYLDIIASKWDLEDLTGSEVYAEDAGDLERTVEEDLEGLENDLYMFPPHRYIVR